MLATGAGKKNGNKTTSGKGNGSTSPDNVLRENRAKKSMSLIEQLELRYADISVMMTPFDESSDSEDEDDEEDEEEVEVEDEDGSSEAGSGGASSGGVSAGGGRAKKKKAKSKKRAAGDDLDYDDDFIDDSELVKACFAKVHVVFVLWLRKQTTPRIIVPMR